MIRIEAGTATRRLALTAGGLALAASAHLGHAPLWIVLCLYGSLGLRLQAARRGWALPPRALLVVLVIVLTLAIVASYRTLNGLQAGTALLMAMAALKAQETRGARDHAVLVYIGYFLCLASLLLDASVLRLVHALLCVWLLTAALLAAQRPLDAQLPVAVSRLSGRLLALGVPLTLVLFVFVPRLEGHFWALPTGSEEAVTGISEAMNPGAIAHLAQSDDPAFRARFVGAMPPREARYWRALVLEEFDGRTWRRSQSLGAGAPPRIDRNGASYRYTVTLEPTQQTWLPALDHLLAWRDVNATRLHDDVWLAVEPATTTPAPVTTVTTFEATSGPGARLGADPLTQAELRRETWLPAGQAPRTIELARTLSTQSSGARDYIARVLERFRVESYSYTLEPPPLGAEPIDEFLFETRAGFCEHYASAFTVLMRAVRLPARVVIGFQGGDYNSYGGYLIVRQSHAHAWSEVWLEPDGWVRFDPTAAIAPERIRSGLDSALPAGTRAARGFLHAPWALKARELADAVRTGWNRAIVGFSAAQQASVLEHLGWAGSPVLGLAVALSVGFAVAGLMLYLVQNLRRRRHGADPVVRAWEQLTARLAKAGCPRAGAEGPYDYARRAGDGLPADAAAIATLAATYVRLRYEPDAHEDLRRAFVRDARRFRVRTRPRTAPPRPRG